PQIKKFRSYWLDCIRNFELVEKTHPRSPKAGDACFDRAEIYGDLYRHSGYSKDSDEAIRIYGACRTAYPGHARMPEALYRIIELAHGRRKEGDLADEAYSRPVKSYPRSRWTIRAKTRMKPSAAKIRRKAPVSLARGRANPAGVVRKIRYRSGGDYTRVVIDHEHKVEYHVRELKNPDRLVFDLLNTRLGSSVDGEPLMVNDGILQQVRASQYAPSIVRVVLDLAVIKSYAVFPLRDPGRLVIDVTGVASDGSGTAVEPTADPGSGSIPQFAHTRAVMAPEAKNGDGLSLSRQLGLKVRTIAIDAGHGGRDPGAIGRRGTKEKDLTLDIAKRLALLVKEGLGCNVVMTRDRDEFIPLEDRPAIARTRGADLFVSIHINASRRSGVRGIETYIQGLSASDRDAMETAARENATTAKTLSELDDELTKILTGLRMESNDEDSIQLAHAVHGSLVAAAKPVQGHVADLGVKRAFFYVLINTGMPSILAEVGFISNPTEEKLMKKGSYRQSIAEAVYRGVKKYVDAREPQREGT
ncbi:MAG TPA: N-acetylmuramoyl-L-alanine amidase, partial [Nitrospirota bacterium]|nr:N-acetylmuramoyl-L-alanine amidase [Nitrospirota bacterium]